MFNDIDLEMRDLADYADETDAATCRACGAIDEAVTLPMQPGDRETRTERYECVCGHVSMFVRGRRQS
jgi:hypothetical protein